MTMIAFGPFRLDPRTLELWRDGRQIPIRPQPCHVLSLLASRAGDLVTREELIAALWPDGVHVRFDLGLNSCLKQVRAALGDDAGQPVWIETLPRRGYRFLRSARSEERAVEPRTKRLLVLPFGAGMPGEELAQPLAGALGDEVAIALSQMDNGVAVLAGAALPEALSRRPSLRTMRDAGVDLVLDCRIHAAPPALRVAAQLVDAREQIVVWAQMFDGSLEDGFGTQRRIARSITDALSGVLGSSRGPRRLAG
jgi:DNA-binding winged helix-turn-helix (wHTH) protein